MIMNSAVTKIRRNIFNFFYIYNYYNNNKLKGLCKQKYYFSLLYLILKIFKVTFCFPFVYFKKFQKNNKFSINLY